MDFHIQLEQRAGDGSVVGSLQINPSDSFVVRALQPVLDSVASQTIHALNAFGASGVVLEAIEAAVEPKALPAASEAPAKP